MPTDLSEVIATLKDVLSWEAERIGVVWAGALHKAMTDLASADMERDAMRETITGLEKDRDTLVEVARLCLQQFEFVAGKRKRGWDIMFLTDKLKTAIEQVEINKCRL